MSKRTAKKKTTKDDDSDNSSETSYSDDLSISNDESEIESVEQDVQYNIQSTQNPVLQELHSFFNDKKMINPPHDPSTNIVDRRAGTCYNVPDRKIPTMFHYIEKCRRAGIHMMYNERQQEHSGIMLDFDIYQNEAADQLNDNIFKRLIQKVCETIIKIVEVPFATTRYVDVYVGITRRPKITYCTEKQCFKDGFHLLIPSIKVLRPVKKLIIKKLLDSEIIDQVFEDVSAASIKKANGDEYSKRDFLDVNSAFVPVFFVGSSSKKGTPAYNLTHAYKVSISRDMVSLESSKDLLKSKHCNVSHEFSLNYQCKIITKANYTVQEKYAAEVIEKPTQEDTDLNRNFGELTATSILDAAIKEYKDLLDALSPKRAEEYGLWRDVIFVLANTSTSYKQLAEYFSRKSPKFSYVSFEKIWNEAVSTPRHRRMLTIGSLYHWAQQDNPDRARQIKNDTAFSILYQTIYAVANEGILGHNDIANLIYKLQTYKYKTDYPEGSKKLVWFEFILDDDDHSDGELYKWRCWGDSPPISMAKYMTEIIPKLMNKVLTKVKSNFDNAATDELNRFYSVVYKNFKASIRKLSDRNFIHNCIKMAEDKFFSIGFAKKLDRDPLVRGVKNGVMKLATEIGSRPTLIRGYHSSAISKYTDIPYIAFNPRDPKTRHIIMTLRNMFPDNEPDTHSFIMYYLASTLDGNPKESMFMIMFGGGSNGKSALVELHKAAIGDKYGVKMNLCFLTGKNANADNATPAIMQLKDATLATYSEANQNEELNAARVKEITGQETLAGRRLREDIVNFRPTCHHLVTTNYKFDIKGNDYGTWRRIKVVNCKIKFVSPHLPEYEPNNPYIRPADSSITDNWVKDEEVRGRYYGYMVWMHYWLYRKYRGKVMMVPHPHIEYETNRYRQEQDDMSKFIDTRICRCEDNTAIYPMSEEVNKYIEWYSVETGRRLTAKGLIDLFKSSSIAKYISKVPGRGDCLIGHRFLGVRETPGENETLLFNEQLADAVNNNLGVESETPEEYYERLCREYDEYKNLFIDEPEYEYVDKYTALTDAEDTFAVAESVAETTAYAPARTAAKPRIAPVYHEEKEDDDRIITDSGVVLKATAKQQAKNKIYESMSGFITTQEELEESEPEDEPATTRSGSDQGWVEIDQ